MSPEITNRPVDRDLIEFRAYEIYLERNGAPGSDVEDWLRAERELLGSPSEKQSDGESTATQNTSLAPESEKAIRSLRAKATKAGA